MSCSLISVSESCIGFGAYGSAWVWRLNVLSPSLRCNLCTPQAGVYMFTKNIVQYQEMFSFFTRFFTDLIVRQFNKTFRDKNYRFDCVANAELWDTIKRTLDGPHILDPRFIWWALSARPKLP
jgi:hypothetical protein